MRWSRDQSEAGGAGVGVRRGEGAEEGGEGEEGRQGEGAEELVQPAVEVPVHLNTDLFNDFAESPDQVCSSCNRLLYKRSGCHPRETTPVITKFHPLFKTGLAVSKTKALIKFQLYVSSFVAHKAGHVSKSFTVV